MDCEICSSEMVRLKTCGYKCKNCGNELSCSD